jgi:hypothetical protein
LPDDPEGFKIELRDDETFQTEFIGATEQECQNWALEHQFQNPFIEQDIIAIADARSTTNNTISIQFYSRELDELDPHEPDLEFGEYGVLPANIALGTTSELITKEPSMFGRP